MLRFVSMTDILKHNMIDALYGHRLIKWQRQSFWQTVYETVSRDV